MEPYPPDRSPGLGDDVDHLTTSTREDDAVLTDIELTKQALHAQAREILGVAGNGRTEKFRALLQRDNLSTYPIVALGLLLICDGFQANALTILTPNVGAALGLGIAGIAACRSLAGLAAAVSPLPMAALTQNRARRAVLCIVTGVAWSLVTLFTGFVTSAVGLFMILLLDGLSTGSVTALHQPLLMDCYSPGSRVRALSSYNAFGQLGAFASPLLVALLAGPLNLTWRGVFLCLGALSLLMSLASLALRDPGFGKWDTEKLRSSVHTEHGDATTLPAADIALGFWEICRRVLIVPTNKRIMAAAAVVGLMLIPFQTFLSFFLLQRWNLDAGGRGLFFAYAAAISAGALLVYGTRGEQQFHRSPSSVLRASGAILAAGVALIALGALSPWFVGMLIGFGLGSAAIGLLTPALSIALMSIVPANTRAHSQSIFTIFLGLGSLVGALLLGNIQNQYGDAVTVIVIAAIGIGGSLILGSAGKLIDADLDRMIDIVLEDEEVKRLRDSGARLPLLTCRGISFSYGQMQVLFNVDFTLDDGEMVALLGVNGAGKSTLLKVISGIGLPSRGSVRFRGHEITYLDAERRVRLGITQIPGGNSVFGPMTVVENLRSYGYSLDCSRQELNRSIETCFEAFPRLYERRSSLAATLSGGEQQMLGLSKALILKPQLLVIDELSLGLAPIIVGQLLDIVRKINEQGTAVVLVEQSVNIALSLVDHAYFMEKGEMRFDGRSEELLTRDDLLRAVFLKGSNPGGLA